MIHLLQLLAATPIGQGGGLPTPAADSSALKSILQIVFGTIGALAVLMITVSGLRFITSSGDPQKATSARNGIIYALIGLLIAITAEAIVTFVVTSL
ncbi:MAG: hypothetical protein ACXWLH_04290 [Candidatus Saccharimonadales bacterium]